MSNDLITEDMVAYTRHLARKLCRSRPFPYCSDVADDMAGVGMVALIQAARSYDARHSSKATFRAYASQAVCNRIKGELGIGKRNSKYKHLPRWHRHHSSLEDLRSDSPADIREDIDPSPPPEYAVEVADEYALALRLMACLDSRERTVYSLHHVEGLNGYAIGRFLGISHTLAYRILATAASKLREAVHAYHP